MNSKKKLIIAIIVIAIIVGAVGGGIVWYQSLQSNELTSPLTIVDGVGRTVTVTEYPDRIVSIAPSCTEILFALDIKDKVVGAPTYTNYSPEIQDRLSSGDLTSVGTFSQISVETIVGLDPDIIFAKGGYQLSTAERLAELGKTVVIVTHEGFDGLLNDISLIGQVCGQDKEAEAFVGDMENRAQAVIDKTENSDKPTVYVEYYFNGGFASYGADSVVNELISMAGGVNIFADVDKQYMETSTEEILKANPDMIIISKGVMSEGCGLTPETVRNRPSWGETTAVQEDQIYEVDENLITVAGPKLIDGLEELAKIFHPDLFPDQ
jgi:iron complex transport system substrate-binding protein